MYEDINCPYCDKAMEINHDDGYGYQEDEIYQQECGHCDKTFVYTTSINFYYEATQAECLNDGEHKYKPMKWTGFPDAKICETCGDEIRGDYVDPFPKGGQ